METLPQASLGDIWARAIEEDTAGHVWITTNDTNLIRLSKDSAGNYVEKIFNEKDGLPTKDNSCLVPGPRGEMWACAITGLVRFQGEEFDFHAFPERLKTRPITGCRASDGTIWAGGGSELHTWNGSAFARGKDGAGCVAGRPGHPFRSVQRPGRVAAVTAKGLIRLRDGKENLYTTKEGLADNVILSLAQGPNREVWESTRTDSAGCATARSRATATARDFRKTPCSRFARTVKAACGWAHYKNGLNQFLDGAATRYAKSRECPGRSMGPLLRTAAAFCGRPP